MKTILSRGHLALLAWLFFADTTLMPLPATAAPPAAEAMAATITFANGEGIKLYADDHFQPVAIAAGETVTIQAQLPPQFTNIPAVAQALDGGSATDIVIASNGMASVSFQAGSQPGLYRLFLSARGRNVVLQFQVSNQG